MLTWGFLLLVGGFLACLILFFGQMSNIFDYISKDGFGGYIGRFFDSDNLTTRKIVFMIMLVLAVLGLVLYIVGRAKNKGEKNTIVPAKVKKYLRDTRGELKKIVWPNFATVARNTGVVLAMCAVTGVVIVGVDALCGWLIQLLLKL